MKKIEASQAREEFSDTLNQVAFGEDRIVLSRHGKDIAALIPLVDLKLLEECEEDVAKRARRRRKKGAGGSGGATSRALAGRPGDARSNPRPRRPGRRRRP